MSYEFARRIIAHVLNIVACAMISKMLFLNRSLVVVDTKSIEWKIRRRWFPRWSQPDAKKRLFWWRGKLVRFGFDGIEGTGEDFLFAIGLIVVFAILIFFAIPLLLLLLDVVVILLIALFGVLSRIFFKRPWIIESTNLQGEKIERKVSGWFASKNEIENLRNEIINGNTRLQN